MNIEAPDKIRPLYLEDKRYYFLKGGRGSGKSWAIIDYILFSLMRNQDLDIICLREVQRSIQHSSKKLLEARIEHHKIGHYFQVQEQTIFARRGAGSIIFQGLQTHTADSIKSMEGIDIAFVEEAQTISSHSLELLVPTIRKNTSKLIFAWNPELSDDAIELLEDGVEDAVKIFINYPDNPFCPEVLVEEAERMRRRDYENFSHIYMGQFRSRSDAQIFGGRFEVTPFEITEEHGAPLHGLDFGFSNDPTAAIRLYIKDNTLYIAREAGKTKLDLDDTADFLISMMSGIDKYPLPCDNARPESISHLQKHGLPRAYSVKKWPGSIEDGIEFIKTFDNIVIHPRCTETANEFKMYCYKTDKRTDEILPDIEDKYNHYLDATRYALGKMIRPRDFGTVSENKISLF